MSVDNDHFVDADEVPSTMYLRTAQQVRAVSSPLRLRILDLFRAHDELTTVDIAPQVEVSRTSLHYHINRLREAGLIEAIGKRRKGKRSETVYRATARTFLMDLPSADDETRRALHELALSQLRLVKQAIDRSHESPVQGVEHTLVARLAGKLSIEAARELRALLVQCRELMAEGASEEGVPFTLGLFFVPGESSYSNYEELF